MDVIILAGGQGTRLATVLGSVPKPLAPVAGRVFLEHLLDFWLRAGATRILLSIGYRAEEFKKHFGDVYRGLPIIYATEKAPLGTGGGLFLAVRTLDPQRAFWILNGDTLLGLDPEVLKMFHHSRVSEMTLAVIPSPAEKRYGGLLSAVDGRILEFSAAGRTILTPVVNGGVYLAEPRLFAGEAVPHGPVSLEGEVFPRWIRDGKKLFAFETTAPFLDIGVPASYARADEFVKDFKPTGSLQR